MAKYCSKYYALKTSIKEQSITIKDALKIPMLNNLGPVFKTYLTIVNDQMQKDEKLEENEVLFKAIEEEKTRIKAKHKASANFASTKSNAKPKKKAAKRKKEFVEWPKCKKCGCKHLADQACKHANEECDKCHKKGHISRFHDSYTSLNKGKTSQSPATASTSDFKKNVSCVTQIVANKMFETGVTRKIIADSGTTQHLIANRDLIRDYYDDYSEYQTGSGEVLPSYGKGTLLLPLDNGFLKLSNVWYAPDLGFNLISTIQLGEKGVEMWLRTTDQPSQILHDGAILGYADPIDGQYVFRLKDNPEPPAIVNSADTKRAAKPADIELWHSRMGHLGYRSLKTLKDLSSGMDFKDTAPKELCGDCRKGNQTRQPSRIPMSQSTEFLDRVHSDLEGPFPRTRQGYRYYISFLEESTGLIDIEPLKYKDDALAAFKDYKALRERQSGCQLKVLHTDGGGEYMGEFDDYLKENGITHEVTAPYSPEQNGKAERVNRTIMGPVRAILAQQKLPKSLWAEIAKAVVYLRNRSPISQGSTTAYENLKSEKPYLGHLRILGCRVWVHIPKEKRKKLDERSYQGIHVGYEGTNQYRVYDPHSGRVSVTRDAHFDEAHLYDRKDLKPQEFADDEWHKKDDELFADPTDILDASEPTPEWHTIPRKSSQTYPYSDESRSSSPLSDIPDPVGDQEHEEEDGATSEDEESRLQLNRGDRDSGIQPSDATPKRSRQDRLTEPTPGTRQSARIKDKIPASANVMRSISASSLVRKSHIYMVTVLANLNAGCDDSGPDESLSLRETMASSY